MSDPHNLQRFVDAQEEDFNIALDELRAGSKRNHWIWYIFPQLEGLGRSSTAKFYGPSSAKAIQDTGVTPGTLAAEADVQVEYDDNGEPLPENPAQQQQDLKKKVEDDPVVKKALEVLGAKA